MRKVLILAASVFAFFYVCVQDNLRTAERIVLLFSHNVRRWNSSDALEDEHHWAMCQLTIGEKHTFFTKKTLCGIHTHFTPVNPNNDIN